jgi:hypothetical protein
MLSFAIWNEYTWYPRTVAALPDGVVVARAQENSAPWRPWTYVRPIVTRFSAVDTRMNRTNPEAPGQVLTTVLLVGPLAARRQRAGHLRLRGRPPRLLTGDAPLEGRADWEELPPPTSRCAPPATPSGPRLTPTRWRGAHALRSGSSLWWRRIAVTASPKVRTPAASRTGKRRSSTSAVAVAVSKGPYGAPPGPARRRAGSR